MQYKQLGTTNLMISPLAFGGNVLGWTLNEKNSFDILDAFVAGGGNFIDTADVYARWATGVGGESETILGNWLKTRKHRNQLVLATKVGMEMGPGCSGLSKKYILKAVEASLKRLQCDYIDLYQSHKDDEKTPQEETLSAYEQLIKEGKIRYIGASNFNAKRLTQALEMADKFGLPKYQTLQPHYHLLERKLYETELESLCTQHHLGVINYFPLASGFLTGKYRSEADMNKSIRGSSMGKFMHEKGFALLKVLDEVASNHRVSPATVTLAWYLSRPSISAPIVSATSTEQLNQILAAAALQLNQTEIKAIDQCSGY